MYLPTSNLSANCGLTCVVSIIFCAITCAVTEVASGIVNASNKELQSLDSYCTLCSIYIFVSTTPSFHFVIKNALETELGEALNDKEIYLKSDGGTQLVL